MTKEFDVNVSCSRDSHDRFTIRIRDEGAVNASFEVTLTPENFAYLVSSMIVKAKATVRRPDLFGKKRISERRSIKCPLRGHGREPLKKWLIDNCQEDGWELDPYLGSQGSVTFLVGEDGCMLNYRVQRWEDKDEQTT